MLDYDHWNAGEILDAVLPEELMEESPTSYTQTGHIGELD
jgi:tRNA (guanine37-N1)-methyltransferase